MLPSLLRKRFNRVRCGLFLHSPFPSSEIFRTFPKRDEVLRSLLNADLVGALQRRNSIVAPCYVRWFFSHHLVWQFSSKHVTLGEKSALTLNCTTVASAGFHTFDYARHFLSCCSRMLGVEHVTQRGAIMLE